MNKVVGVRFQRSARIYDFDPGEFELKVGHKVIVETEHGQVLGTVARPPLVYVEPPGEEEEHPPLKVVYRVATEEDLATHQDNCLLEREAWLFCKERIADRKLDMNLVKVECIFDRSKMLFYFTAESRQDFRELVKDLVSRFRTRVEMRQIGVRHEAKLLGGLGSCGRELCCTTFLKDFEPVSVKMAKEQNLSLNPTKISGLCGRLMCCLTYEYETYRHLKQGMPKLGKRLRLKDGTDVKVIRQSVLDRKLALLVVGENREIIVTPEELAELLPEGSLPGAPPPEPAAAAPDQSSGETPEAPAEDSEESSSGEGRSGGRGRGRRKRIPRKANR
ncbi:MAG: stage 0 sporulation family protein [Deltaproteobacteria bacterium]|nr:stage 0 sporulation family protein [Deltaproteobacteria bacterium]